MGREFVVALGIVGILSASGTDGTSAKGPVGAPGPHKPRCATLSRFKMKASMRSCVDCGDRRRCPR